MLQKPQFLALGAVLVAAACSDNTSTAPARAVAPAVRAASDRLPRSHERYVAIGTSISMGWASNGVYAVSQALAWPQLLAFGSSNPITLPLIQSPGCISPLVAPLANGRRLSGESIAGSTTCAPLVPGITLPTQNVALATAIAADVLQRTPEAAGASAPWYGRVLPPGATQLSAALSQDPTIVSFEIGGNEVLGATSGLVAPGVTVVPFPFFAQPFNAIMDALSFNGKEVVVLGLPKDARNLAALRRGDEIWANREEFASLNVTVSNDCEDNRNYINVSLKSLNMVFAGAAARAAGQPNPVFSCADIPGTPDLVLTPNDIAAMNALLAQMDAHIQDKAASLGFAYFSLGVLYDRKDIKASPYSVVHHMTSRTPFGHLISLDGVHPSPLGHTLLAINASKAINDTYGASPDFNRVTVRRSEMSLADQLDERMLPSQALELARSIANNNRGVQLSPCSVPGGCNVERASRMR